MTAAEWEALAAARDALSRAPHGGKDEVAARCAHSLGCSVATLYRRIKQAGFESGRKRRCDAGSSAVTLDEAKLAAGVLLASTNKKGQHMPMNTAVDILRANGQLASEVSASTVARQLYANGLHPKQLALPKASIELSSRHPNHVWQVDSTTGAYYYLPGGRLRWMPEDEFYKNKVGNLVKASTDLLTRYAAADHTSHAFKCRYYLGGETVANFLDFICWAMWKQDASPMHGVPQILMMDPGAANNSLAVTNFCRRLGIEPKRHAPGAANVTGSVEKVHDIARMHFETRLRFVDPEDVTLDMLNAEIEVWAAAHCSTRVHTRHKLTRYGKWMQIRADLGQLRVAASLEALREAAQREPKQCRVGNTLEIQFGSRIYRVDAIPGVHPAAWITVVQNVFRAPAIDVRVVDRETGQETWQIVEPKEVDEHGYGVGAARIGEEMRSARNSHLDDARNALTKQAYRQPGGELPSLEEAAKARKQHAQAYAGALDVMADVKATEVPTYLPRRGTALESQAPRTVVAARISIVEVCKRAKPLMGDDYDGNVYGWLSARFGDEGVPEDQVESLIAQFVARDDQAATGTHDGSPGLHVVGGAA